MHTFFKGWRRKTGCTLLGMACFVSTLWIRSLGRSEDVFFSLGQQTTVQLISRESTLTLRKFVARVPVGTEKSGPDRLLLLGVFPPTNRSTGNVAFSADEVNRAQLGTPYAWRFKMGGMGLATFQDNELQLHVGILTLPYWSLAVPLTLLSAYLILVPSRKLATSLSHA